MAAADIFMKMGDIKGESQDSKHKDEIAVLSWSWGVTNSGSMAFGSGGGEGKASFHDLTFQHLLDKASPVLMQYCAVGKHMPSAVLTARKSGGDQQEYLVLTMSDVIVTSVQTGGQGSDLPTENIALGFAKMVMEYKAQKADGSLDAAVKAGYDIKQNVKV